MMDGYGARGTASGGLMTLSGQEPVGVRMAACGVTDPSGPVRSLRLPRPPAPGPGEILIDVVAAGVGPWDRHRRPSGRARGPASGPERLLGRAGAAAGR